MIIIEPRHKPVFSMSVIRKICDFAELNFFQFINERFEEAALSLETTVRINEVNFKIINEEQLADANKNYDHNVLDCVVDTALLQFKELTINSNEFFAEVIQFSSVCDLSKFPTGSYIFYSLDGTIPDLTTCHAFFAISNNCKLEVALNRFEKLENSASTLIIGAIMI